MALAKSSDADLRVYEPRFGCEYASDEEEASHRSSLLDKIQNAYRKAGRGAGAGAGLRGGLCFGLLDPASNIVVNTLIAGAGAASRRAEEEEEEAEAELEGLKRRSLDGMVTFLTRFFPYLAACEAVFYLLFADADLLIATRVIAADRRMKRFGASEPEGAVGEALEMALTCAALAAGHPDPGRLVDAWLAVSTRLDEAVDLLAKVRRRGAKPSALRSLRRLLRRPPAAGRRDDHLCRAWQLAASRCPRRRAVPYQYTSIHLKRGLLDAIHGFYLQALARLPAGELRARFHYSLVMAGHCYGPLDPVSNILLNAICHAAAFPPAAKLELDMVTTAALLRIETRSMFGLVSFLCTRYRNLNFHRAMRCLLDADGSLIIADPNLDAESAAAATAALRMEERKRSQSPWSIATGSHSALGSRANTEAHAPATSVSQAFKAAAIACKHPNPDAQATLLAACKPMLDSAAMALLQGGGQLSSEDIQRIAGLLSPESACEKPLVQKHAHACTEVSEKINAAYTRISKKISAALNVYASMSNGEPTYEIHGIYGVNKYVSGPVDCPESSECPPVKYYHSHVNFLATPKATDCHAAGAPVLFFAEISNEEEGEVGSQSFCCPVWIPPPCAERVRCLYCDFVGTRIVHPFGKHFHGREKDFEKMVCGEDPFNEDFDPKVMPQYYTNMGIISHSSLMAESFYGRLQEDCLYTDSSEEESDEDYSDTDCSSDDECC
ncbi:hypothetical protein ACP4OV_003176 [Aristida adscensionis]